MTIINTTNGGGAKTIAGEEKPSSFPSEYPAPEGYDGWSKLTIEAPDNLSADNIRKDVEIAGVTGTYEPSLTVQEGTITEFPMTYTTPEGFYGMSTVIAHAPETLVADNIKKGVDVAGIVGVYEGDIGEVEVENATIYPGDTEADRPILASDYGYTGLSKVILRGTGQNWREHPITGEKYLWYPRGYEMPGGSWGDDTGYNWKNFANELSGDCIAGYQLRRKTGQNIMASYAYKDNTMEGWGLSKVTRTNSYTTKIYIMDSPYGVNSQYGPMMFNAYVNSNYNGKFCMSADLIGMTNYPPDREPFTVKEIAEFTKGSTYWSLPDGTSYMDAPLTMPVNGLTLPSDSYTWETEFHPNEMWYQCRECARGPWFNLYDANDNFLGSIYGFSPSTDPTTITYMSDWSLKQWDVRRVPDYSRFEFRLTFDSSVMIPTTVGGVEVAKMSVIVDICGMYLTNFISMVTTT